MNLLDIIYPPRCPMCQEILYPRKERICPVCREKLPYIREPVCASCGKPLESQEQEYCFDCGRRGHLFDQGISVWVYNETVRKSIYQYKYGQKREYAGFYIEEMAKALRRKLPFWKPELIVPIPIHKSRLRQRGYNQAALLADGISGTFGLPMREKLLVRRRRTLPQKELNVRERRNNLRRAFEVTEDLSYVTSLLLVDDIFTTGATIDVAAELLKAAGVRKVYFITLAAGYGM